MFRYCGELDSSRAWRLQQLPGARDVPLLGVQVADRQPQHEPAVQPRVRQEDLAAAVDRVEQALVERVAAPRAEADDAEGHGASRSNVATGVDPRAKSRARRMCSASRARRPVAPKCRSTIHSFSARNRRPS